jgi:2-hydroxychromene-2-carboxylate isomerase|eukprot:gene39244-48474_t
MEPIDFYFDFGSPYGYFAATCIDELAARHRREVRWHPIMMAAVFETTGGMPLPMVPIKGNYVQHDMDRTARQHGIVYRQPATFPQLLLGAPRAMLWIRQEYGDELAVRFAKRCLHAYFADRVDVADDEVLGGIAAGLGVPAHALLAAIRTREVKELLKQETAAAMARGVFGSPFVIADKEPFWGFDRFGQLEAWLAGGGVSWSYWARKPKVVSSLGHRTAPRTAA